MINSPFKVLEERTFLPLHTVDEFSKKEVFHQYEFLDKNLKIWWDKDIILE